MGDHAAGSRTAFVRRTVVLEPGESWQSDGTEWHDALVLLVQGTVDLECAAGGRRRFPAGAALWLAGIDLRAVHNAGVDVAVLLAISRLRR